jgi:O-antigen ligase
MANTGMDEGKTANGLVFDLLLAVVVLAPLPLASDRPIAWSGLALAVGLLCVGWAAAVATGRARAPMPAARLTWVLVPFVLVLIWIWVQTLSGVPAAWRHPLWAEVAAVLGGAARVRGAISLDPELTRTGLMRLATYGGVFWLAVQLGRERVRARRALVVLAVAGLVYAAYGLAIYFSGSETILWMRKWAYIGDVTATFVNRDAYGAYAGIGLLCCLGLFIHSLRHVWRSRGGPRDHAETILVDAAPFLAGALVIGTALMLTHSRGAFIATGTGIAALLAFLSFARVIPARPALAVGGLILAVAVAVMLVSGDGTFMRFVYGGITDHTRIALHRLVLEAIGDAPWTGYGYGAFEPAFRIYRDTALPQAATISEAHQIYLQTAMGLGLPAMAALSLSIVAILGGCLRGLVRRRRDHVFAAVGLAVALLLGVEGSEDFALNMPAVAVTLALLLGIAYAQSYNTSVSRQDRREAVGATPSPDRA